MRDPLCCICGHKASTVADHNPLTAREIVEQFGINAFYESSRCQGLCASCHASKTAYECGWAGQKAAAIERFDNCGNVTVVCGLPASGKTTYVQQHKVPEDLVWDYDVENEKRPGSISALLARRDAFIQSINGRRAWIIITRSDSKTTRMLAIAGATVIELDTPSEVRQQRLLSRLETE